MSGKRRKYSPEFREQVARLVIETGRPLTHVAAEIGVGEQVLSVGCASNAKPPWLAILARCWMPMNAQS
jgi:transposase-like protein